MSRRLRLALLVPALILGLTVVVDGGHPPLAAAFAKTAPDPMTADDGQSISSMYMSNVGGPITDVNVILNGVDSTYPDDVDLYLLRVVPHFDTDERTVVSLMSDVCGPGDLVDASITIDDEAPGQFTDTGPCSSGTSYRPRDVDQIGDTTDIENGPFGEGQYSSSLATFDGLNASAEWFLTLHDDATGDVTSFTGGWTLEITTGSANIRIPKSSSSDDSGPAAPYPRSIKVSGRSGTISDLDVEIAGFSHSNIQDVDMLLVGPRGQSVLLMSDACFSQGAADWSLTFDDEATASLPVDVNSMCSPGSYKPTDHNGGTDVFPDPAPAAPYAHSLAAFDGTGANGIWRLYVMDDTPMWAGFIEDQPVLDFTMNPPAQCHGQDVSVDLSLGDKATNGDDVILGTSGDDRMFGFGGNDVICGGGGNDLIQGGKGDDLIDGGAGRDQVSYTTSQEPVSVDLARTDAQFIGAQTGHDTILDVSDLSGGPSSDFLFGDDDSNIILGRSGADEIYGRGGDDLITGGPDVDYCDGGDDSDAARCEDLLNVP